MLWTILDSTIELLIGVDGKIPLLMHAKKAQGAAKNSAPRTVKKVKTLVIDEPHRKSPRISFQLI
jgi:hypothetical protein